jgi:hypothetical protein
MKECYLFGVAYFPNAKDVHELHCRFAAMRNVEHTARYVEIRAGG